nr:unnamed protein product [Spirometra erinaceieuropaei]
MAPSHTASSIASIFTPTPFTTATVIVTTDERNPNTTPPSMPTHTTTSNIAAVSTTMTATITTAPTVATTCKNTFDVPKSAVLSLATIAPPLENPTRTKCFLIEIAHSHHISAWPINGLIGARASVDDFDVVYHGMEIECAEEVKSSGQSFWLYGSMLKCVSKFPISKPWTLLAGSSYKCPMDTVENVLIIPRMDENCVVVYSCSAFANADRTEIVSIRVTIEVIACDQVHYVTIEPLLGASISVGGTVRCATVQACEHRFVYSLYLTDVTGNYDDSVQPFFSNSTPLKITHDMLGSKIITCVTRGIHQKELRATRRVIIEGQPYGIQLIRKNQGDESLDIDVNIVNANETLQCDSGGYPRPEIIWQHVSSPKNHPTHQLTIHRDSLITTIFDPPGYYTYTCHSRNELGEISLKHTFYLRNSKHISFGQQTIVFCWVLANLLIFAFLVWMGQLIVNRDLIQFAED